MRPTPVGKEALVVAGIVLVEQNMGKLRGIMQFDFVSLKCTFLGNRNRERKRDRERGREEKRKTE